VKYIRGQETQQQGVLWPQRSNGRQTGIAEHYTAAKVSRVEPHTAACIRHDAMEDTSTQGGAHTRGCAGCLSLQFCCMSLPFCHSAKARHTAIVCTGGRARPVQGQTTIRNLLTHALDYAQAWQGLTRAGAASADTGALCSRAWEGPCCCATTGLLQQLPNPQNGC
jgi:hypothetical protein